MILEKIGISPRGYQENLRSEFVMDGATLSIDTWPKLQPFLEIEAATEEEIVVVAQKLGFDKGEISYKNVDTMYLDRSIVLREVPSLVFE